MPYKKITFSSSWVYLLLLLLSFVLFGNTIPNNYGLDDEFVVTQNSYVQKGIHGIPEILDNPYAQIGTIKLDNRPIVLISFALENHFFGNNPHVGHLINILLFALCLMVLYLFLIYVLQLDSLHPVLPVSMVVLFAIHPIHTEVVSSLKNRDELFSLLFGFLFLIAADKFFKEHKTPKKFFRLVSAIVLLILCLLSKLTGILFVGIISILVVFKDYHKQFTKKSYLYILLFFVILIVRLVGVLKEINRITQPFENSLEENGNIVLVIATSLKILLYHLKMLLVPYPLRFYYGFNMFPVSGFFNFATIASILIHAGLLYIGFKLFAKRKLLGFFILAYFASVILYANFPIPYTGMYSERAQLISSFWFIGIVVMAILAWVDNYNTKQNYSLIRKSVIGLFVIVFAVYSFLTIQRNFLWKDNLTLMQHDIPTLDQSVLANYMYANNLVRVGSGLKDSIQARNMAIKAASFYQKCVELAPLYPEYYFKLANTYRYGLKEHKQAIQQYQNAIAADTLYTFAYYELGKLYFDKKDYFNSYKTLAEAYSLNFKDTLTLFYFGQAAELIGDMPTSYRINTEFLNLYPDLEYPYLNLGRYYSSNRKDDSAVIYFEKAIELGNRNPELLQQMSVYFQNKKMNEKATYYKSLIK